MKSKRPLCRGAGALPARLAPEHQGVTYKGYGYCPRCWKLVKMRQDGRLRLHKE